jgi:hypothetical protein
MRSGAWSNRFVICAEAVVNELAFLIYGSRFAKLLELPERPTRGIPITRQLPGRYLTLFTEGRRHAIAQGASVRLSGVVVNYGQIELYRAAFMPLAMPLNSSKQLVFGTFNRRIGPKASSSDAIRTTYNWLFGNIQANRGPRINTAWLFGGIKASPSRVTDFDVGRAEDRNSVLAGVLGTIAMA